MLQYAFVLAAWRLVASGVCGAAQADAEWRAWRAMHLRLVEQRPSAPAASERKALRARGGALLADLLALARERALDR